MPTLDAVSTDFAPVSSSSLIFPHTTANQPDRAMIVGVAASGSSLAASASGVTYNGVALSLIGAIGVCDSSDDVRVELWRLAAPAVGTHDVEVTFSQGDAFLDCGALTAYGVDQTTIHRALSSRTAGGVAEISTTLNPTSLLNDLVIDIVGFRYAGQGTVTIGGSQTENWESRASRLKGSRKTGAAGTTTMTWSWATGGWTGSSQIAIALMPVASVIAPIMNSYRRRRAS